MLFQDLEDNDDLYGRVSLDFSDNPDNLTFKGPFYLWRGTAPEKAWPISIAWTREIEPPWRNGIGILIRRNEEDIAVGLVYKRQDPRKRKLGFFGRRGISKQRTAEEKAGIVLSRKSQFKND